MTHPVDHSTRLLLKLMAAGAASLATGCAMRDPSKPPEEGFEYRAGTRPWPTETKGKLEVAEIFWFGCPFCNAFDPVLDAWFARQPADVVLRKVHPAVNKSWLPHAQLYWSLETMGRARDLTSRVYYALHARQMSLDRREEIASFVASEGVDRTAFLRVFDSAEVQAKIEKANEMAKVFKLDGVPAVVVNGKWFTAPHMTGTRENALRVVEFLLAMERRGG